MGKNNATNPNYELRIARRQLDINGDGRVTRSDYELAFYADPTTFGDDPGILQSVIDANNLISAGSQRTFSDEFSNYLDPQTLDVMFDVNGDGLVNRSDYELAFYADPTNFGDDPETLQTVIDDNNLISANSTRRTATEIIQFMETFFPAINSRDFGNGVNNTTTRSSTSSSSVGQVFIGNDQANEFIGSTKDDTFYSGTGDELLTGGGGSNTFVFGINNGNDTITDFKASQDVIRIVNNSSLGFTNTNDIINRLTQDNHNSSQLILGNNGLLNINHDQPLSADNFVLI
jgi:hypothetical protein